MTKKKGIQIIRIALITLFILSSTLFYSGVGAENHSANITATGFTKGPSFRPVVPTKKVTFINFGQEGNLDDYAYLAALSSSVFYDSQEERLFSHPLLFYQDYYTIEKEKERSLNARQGIDYFMEDWMTYCYGQLDKMTVVNVPRNKLDSTWRARNITMIEGSDPYTIASEMALDEWSYSDEIVVASITETNETVKNRITGAFSGTLPRKEVQYKHFEVPQTNQLNPVFNEFTVPDGYTYLKARAWYPCFYHEINPGGFQSMSNISIPPGDKDLQLYCNYDGDWMQTAAISYWNQKFGMDTDIIHSYVYKNGPWRVGITDLPTKGTSGTYGTLREILKGILFGVVYNVDITMYPGIVIPINDLPSFGCGDATFTLRWNDPTVKLGFALIGPSGEEIISECNTSKSRYQEIQVDQLGQCLEGETYSICVFSINDLHSSLDFEIGYSWGQQISKAKANSLTSATEGAILSSLLNVPLIYCSPSKLPSSTKETLLTLGVKTVYLVDIGGNCSSTVISDIKEIASITKHYVRLQDIYSDIGNKTSSNDVVFSTLNPWSYWFVGEMKPAGEYPGALHLGPAAFIAAHHGTPVLIIDNHPELSSAVVWHNEFWKRTASNPVEESPSVSEMYLTGTRVYNFLKAYDFDQIGRETIITIGGQYDIAPTWDRMFPGEGNSGKFLYSPVDTAYWIARNIFYPSLIFVNPAMNPSGVTLMNGSKNYRRAIFARGTKGLKFIKQPGEETFIYPVHLTYASYQHRLNERASKYYGFKYQTADGIIPGETRTLEPIDQGSIEKYTGTKGCFWPDMSTSEVVPFYMKKGGYDCAFCSNFQDTVNNLNKGVLYWFLASHGGHPDSGLLIFWDPLSEGASLGCSGLPLPPGAAAKNDPNPWRAYDWYLGSTQEPDTLSAEIHGILPALVGNPNLPGLIRTALDWAPAKKPIRDILNSVLSKIPIIRRILSPGRLDAQDYYDGQIVGAFLSTLGTTWYTGWALDDTLENIHSMIFITGVCLTATKYAHLAMIRHGSVCQIIDPWPTSWYGAVWEQSIPRDIILGDTLGEAYNKGISHVGILYIGDNGGPPQWWWDDAENVCFFGDPNLRMFVPETTYSDKNHWDIQETHPLTYDAEICINGHMPFGVFTYPQQRTVEEWNFTFILSIVIIAFVSIVLYMATRFKSK
jgi:hypothetical protein